MHFGLENGPVKSNKSQEKTLFGKDFPKPAKTVVGVFLMESSNCSFKCRGMVAWKSASRHSAVRVVGRFTAKLTKRKFAAKPARSCEPEH